MEDPVRDVKDAFDRVLMAKSMEERVLGISKYFSRDASFCHPGFVVEHNRDAIWGIYQLWACNQARPGIGITYLSVLYDEGRSAVLLDVLEHCAIWWLPTYWLGLAGPTFRLHTVLELADTPRGKVIQRQIDHVLVGESLTDHNLPQAVQRLVHRYWLQPTGRATAQLGNLLYSRFSDPAGPLEPRPVLLDPERSIPEAITRLFNGTGAQRYELVHQAYTHDCQYHNTLCEVTGRDAVFGVLHTWAAVNRRIRVEINSIVASKDHSEVLITGSQFFQPWWWPFELVLLEHIMLHTVPNPDSRGRLIARHSSHLLLLESLLRFNLGPVSWAVERVLRPAQGSLFGLLGRQLYYAWQWVKTTESLKPLSDTVVGKVQAVA